MSSEPKRAALDSFSAEEIDVNQLAVSYPDCSCESAASVEGSPGQVTDDEVLRLFLTSRSDIDGKKESQRNSRTFRATSLQKAYTNGLSTYRLSHATKAELEHSAEILHADKLNNEPKFGGVLAVMDFPVVAVRTCSDSYPPMCVLETPLGKMGAGQFSRPSHCDVVNSVPITDQEDRVATRRTIFNQIKEQGTQTRAEDVTDCDLGQFLPKVIQDAQKS